ncbi:MAG: peptidoglycan-binding protein [Oscillospiraceae bacterium]|nr:peptidoglycan-binding protein [Oscillospiraceae bacterium]
MYDTFVHIDTRQSKSFWYGHGQERRATFGEAGPYTLAQFVREVQAATGSAVDGIPGPETLGNTVTVSTRVNRAHPVVKAVQKRLYALGYTQVGEADGVAGAKFREAVIAFQTDNGCAADGEITARNKTWRKLLEMQ